MAKPHELAQLATRIRKAAQELDLISEGAFDLNLLNAFDELLDVRIQLLKLHVQLMHTVTGSPSAQLEEHRREVHGDRPLAS